MDQTVGFVRSADGTRIAYATAGGGAGRPILRAGTISTHIQLDQDSLVWGHSWNFLANGRTLVRYDSRGCGLSEREVDDLSLEARVADLEAVAGEIEADTFDLFGHGIGTPIALEYACRHPERVNNIVILSGFARGPASRGLPIDPYLQVLKAGENSAGLSYDVTLTSLLVPDGSREQQQVCRDLIRASSSAEMIAAAAQAGTDVDVTDRLPGITAPTLILHSRGGLTSTVDESRLMASMIKGARLVELETRNQVLLEDEPAWGAFTSEVRAFLSDGVEVQERPAIDGLSDRESQVLRRVAEGATDREIAHEFDISVRTVGNHMKSILRKTDSATRAQAAVWAANKGLL